MNSDRELPPEGFSILKAEPNEKVIEYRSHGIGCVLLFIAFGVFGICGSFTCIFLLDPGEFFVWLTVVWKEPWWAPLSLLAGAAALCYFSWFLLFHLFGLTTFTFRPEGLTISKSLFGLNSTRHILRSEMQFVEQSKDGGEGEDTFPSWALALHSRRRHYLLKRQRIEKSDWLGSEITTFFQIEFRPSPKRT